MQKLSSYTLGSCESFSAAQHIQKKYRSFFSVASRLSISMSATRPLWNQLQQLFTIIFISLKQQSFSKLFEETPTS